MKKQKKEKTKSKQQILTVASLPTEILHHIFGFLDYKNLCKVARVCKHWKREADVCHRWK